MLCELLLTCWVGIQSPPRPLLILELFQVPTGTGTCLSSLLPHLWKARQEKE